MTGIVMAGRTGGAFAAQLGTMRVNQEIDALKTLGISPMAFLVLSRMLALALMMPLLCLHVNVMGILASIFAIGSNSVFLDVSKRTMTATGNPSGLLAETKDLSLRLFLTRGEKS